MVPHLRRGGGDVRPATRGDDSRGAEVDLTACADGEGEEVASQAEGHADGGGCDGAIGNRAANGYESGIRELMSDAPQFDLSTESASPRRRNTMSWSYVAGFFDGEGCIRLYQRGVQWSVAQSGQRGVAVLTDIKMFMSSDGITSSLYRPKQTKTGTINCLVATGRENVSYIIGRLMPFLHVKKSECQDVLRYFRLFPSRAEGKALGLCISRGRREGRRSKGKAVLCEDQVKEIRLRLAGGERQASLALRYGVHFNTIAGIKRGTSWTWLV
jgi:hypothetical protein